VVRPVAEFNGAEAMKYRVALRKTDEGYSVSCPGLPGCWSQGATEQEALDNIRSAIQEYLSARDELFEESGIRQVEVTV
jgi:predicted RNase H-like HicB family nuclease